ncbi:Transducin/WD40 repeat-like superfamily protein [Rhynchospora pubera]|uniref:Transducin/WD40 repeat-like superfamily protein n=1 Tax=Rhynchospora pubera TaxID=906938 RepID=A0AAV8EBC6_9POAL|nr:Transducin/WD40 repeat-like superfamily protein [Rhynchospora pubera]
MISSRLKERGGAGGKIMASKPSKTLHPSPPAKLRPTRNPSPNPITNPSRKIAPLSSSKENPSTNSRSLSAGRRRDPTPTRIEKPSTARASAVRRSTSSVPRSRAPLNPSDFSRLVSNLHGDRTAPTRVSTDRLGRAVEKGIEGNSGLRRSASGGIRVSEQDSGKGKGVKSNLKSDKVDKVVCSSEISNSSSVELRKDKVLCSKQQDSFSSTDGMNKASLPTFTVKWDYVPNPCNSGGVGENREKEAVRVSDKVKIFEKVIDDSVVAGLQGSNNYPSKLHEKLSMLEGRVQKIASEIKRTKEILDDSNPDESRLILSEIQNKISSVEKAVGHVITDGSKNGADKILICAQGAPKFSTKGLNCEELESRFFPHQKLLKNNVSKNAISLNQIEERSIEVEFLASLSGTKSTVCVTGAGSKISSSEGSGTNTVVGGACEEEIELCTDEKIEDFDSQESKQVSLVQEETGEASGDELRQIGSKCAAGGWFVSEGEAVLLAHTDGTCSYYDIVNCENKTEYKPDVAVPQNTWGDCWLVRAPGPDGCSGRYVVAASAGPTPRPGFCCWDFYKRNVSAIHLERESQTSDPGKQWWYRPCGPLLLSTSSKQKAIMGYDIRDGDMVMKWEMDSAVGSMDWSCPLQWRSRGKVVILGSDFISLWDVNSVDAQPLLSIGSGNKRVCALHVSNTDAEISGGIRQRVSSSEAEGNDGVFSTQESINVLDFRVPTGTGLKVSRHGGVPVSIYSRGDSVFVGSTEDRLQLRSGRKSWVQHFSLRRGKLVASYELPVLNTDYRTGSVSQVWGNSNLVMGVCGKGLFVFDALKDSAYASSGMVEARETINTDADFQCPTFDYSGSRLLLVSRDRPALWRYLS